MNKKKQKNNKNTQIIDEAEMLYSKKVKINMKIKNKYYFFKIQTKLKKIIKF